MNLKSNYFVVAVVLAVLLVFSFAVAKQTPQELKAQKAQLEQQKIEQLRVSEKDMPWTRNPDPVFRHGGPDAGGYYYIDSDDNANNKPVYNWVDISGVGTMVEFVNGSTPLDDGWSNPIDMGMTFNYYGQDFNQIIACVNGFATFDASLTSAPYSNAAIPTSSTPNNIIAVEWDDFDARPGGTCYYYYDPGENRFILSWTDWPYYYYPSGQDPHNFQVIFYAGTNQIICQYGDNPGTWQADVTQGIENGSGTIGTQYAYNNATTYTGLAIYYGLDAPTYGTHNIAPQTFLSPGMYGQVGSAVTPQVRFANIGGSQESFPVRLQIYQGANLLYNQTSSVSNLPSGSTADVTFPDWTPASEAIYTMRAISELGTDENRTNDTLDYAFQVFGQIVYLDFEGDGAFTPTGDWEWGTPTVEPDAAHSGVNAWGTTLGGDYPTNDYATLTTEEYNLGISSVLKFWQWYDTESGFDGGNVKITTDGGTTWELLHPDDGYDVTTYTSCPLYPDSVFSGHTAGNYWHEVSFDLSAYDNQTVVFRFDFGSDGSIDYPGWTIDDFTLLGAGTYAHNVAPTRFLAPGLYGQAGDPITPVVVFRNVGDNTESFPVRLQIYQGANLLYNQTSTVTNLASRANDTITFPNYTPASEAIYTLVAITELGTDEMPANDTLRYDFRVYQHMSYYDFEADGVFTPDGDWEWGTPVGGPGAAHGGASCWGIALNSGTYPASDYATLTTTPFGLGPGAMLTFFHWYDTESRYDGGNVKISSDGGGSWEMLYPMEGYDNVGWTSNPLYPDSIFTGSSSGGWTQVTFDLSAYAATSVLFRFDFGADASVQYDGWYLDDLTVLGGAGVEPGWATGTVTNLAGGAPINGAIVTIGRLSDTTGADGVYWLRAYPGTYPVTASAAFHNSATANVTIVENDTVTQNFALTAPMISVDNTAIHDTLALGATRDHVRTISNTGNGQLDFNITLSYSRLLRPGNIIRSHTPGFDLMLRNSEITEATQTPGNIDPPVTEDFGDEVFTFDPQTPTGDEACLGIEFDGTHFWVSGRHPVDEVHMLHKFDAQGNYIESFNQGTSSTWGIRDLAWDGEYLYASDESGLYQIDTADGQIVDNLPAPSGFSLPCRALAWDPATDHFWTANFSSDIVEFDRTGTIINSYSNTLSIYGMAWDNASTDGPWLWVFSQDGAPATLVSQFDPATGSYTGVSFYAIDHNGGDDDLAGGLCFTTQWDPAFGILFCLVQGDAGGVSYDLAQGYEITPYSTWLLVEPRSGSVAPSGSTPITITCDASALNIVNDTTFNGTVIITNNSSVTPQIPVSLRVRVGINDGTILPNNYALFQNYPNPFNAQTLINFALPKESEVDLSVYNVLGQKVATLVSGKLQAGFHQAKWDASNVASGMYYYKIKAGDYTKIQQMTLLK